MNQMDPDFLKISHLEARMRGETELKFKNLNVFNEQIKKNEINSTQRDLFDSPTLDLFQNEFFSSNSKVEELQFKKRKGFYSGKENNFETLNHSMHKKKSLGTSNKNECFSIKKKIKFQEKNSINMIRKGSLNIIPTENFQINNDINLFNYQKKNNFCWSNYLAQNLYEHKENNTHFYEENKMLKNQLETIKNEFQNYKECQIAIKSKLLLEIETFKQKEEKRSIFRMRKILGEFKKKRSGVKFNEIWEDGLDILAGKEKLKKINDELMQNESKVVNSISKMLLEKERKECEEKIQNLEDEKHFFQMNLLRLSEEQNSYFVKNVTNSNCKFPLLKNRYQVLSFIGRGGFSDVYHGIDLENMNKIAIKIHYINPAWTEEIKASYLKHSNRESEVHKKLNHPNIVKLYETIPLEGDSFCSILEYCNGSDLATYLKKNKALTENEAKIIIYEILKGIKYLHEDFDQNTRIIHYDLKPQNILFHNGCLKITDFGLCKIMDILQNSENMELTFKGGGTYWYLPPECFETGFSRINHKVDIWSVGVIFYELVFGKKPFGDQMSQEKIVYDKIILNEADSLRFPISPIISILGKNFIRKCLTYKEEKRWDVKNAINFEYFS